MKKKLNFRLCLFLASVLTLTSCRHDYLPEKETYSNSSAFQLTSKRISLNEAKHKEMLVTELDNAETRLKKLGTANVQGRVVNYGNGVSIDTDHVTYIENGPNFHTYTFHIRRENAPAHAPVENLVLVPLSDGSYKELLVSYQLTPQEKETLANGGFVDTHGKMNITELAQGTYNPMSRGMTSCGWEEEATFVTVCSENKHGMWNVEKWDECSADRKPGWHTTMVYRCNFIYDESDPGGGWWASEGGATDTGGGTQEPWDGTTDPCNGNGVATSPLDPDTNIGDGSSSCSGVPTEIVLPSTDLKSNCEKAKQAYENAAVKSRYEELKGKTSDAKESGYGFKKVTAPDGSTSVETTPLNPDSTDPDGMNIVITPGTYGYAHTHLNKFDGNMAIKIHSPKDINTFVSILRSAKTHGIPLDEVFGGMIASDPDTQYNVYQLMYTGNGNDLPPELSESQLLKLKNEYKRKAQEINLGTGEPLSHYEMQKLFFEILKKMNVKNVVLSKRDYKSKKFYIVEFDEYGNPTEKPCP